MITILVDVKSRRPGCVLIQAAGSGDADAVSELYDPKTWLLFPTDDMYKVTGTRAQWELEAKRCNKEHVDGR